MLAEEERDEANLEPWHALQQWLESPSAARSVTIPYARALADMVPPLAVRLRRDFGALLSLIRAHAVLHQATRERDDRGRIVASLEDYAAVRELVADLVSEGIEATVPKSVREAVHAVARLHSQEDSQPVAVVQVAKELKLDRSVASRRVRSAKDRGFLRDLEDNPRKPSRLVPGDPLPEDLEILPMPQRLEAYKACKRAGETEGRPTPLPPKDDDKDPKEGGGGNYPQDTSARLGGPGPGRRRSCQVHNMNVVKSLKSTGKGAVILPHGVLFRGHAEANIRHNLVRRGYIKGIIGLPPNLFYGTGIPACIIVLDKEHAHARRGIFMIDASRDFMKDGNKNRLRSQDIHKIVDVFNRQTELSRYSRMVGFAEIEANDFNLNIPRYIDSSEPEDLLARFAGAELVSRYDVYQHLMDYWVESMQDDVYAIAQDGWVVGRVVRVAHDRETPEIVVKKGSKTIRYVGELIPARLVVTRFFGKEQAEVERLAAAADAAGQSRVEFEEEHGGEEGALAGLEGKSGIPKGNVLNRVMELRAMALESIPMYTPEYEQVREIKRSTFGTAPWKKGVHDDEELFAELDVLHDYLRLVDAETKAKKAHKEAADALDQAVIGKYPELTEEEIKILVVDDKWFADIERDLRIETERVAQTVAGRVKTLEERYAEPLPALAAEVESLAEKVEGHLKEIGLTWPVHA
jgi:hypothetical protein